MERILEVSRATSVAEDPCIIRWKILTLRSNSGVSWPLFLSLAFAFFVFTTTHVPDESPQSGRNTPGGRGRGSPLQSNGNNTPRGRGGRGGRGGYTQKLPPTSSLSSLWNEERPLLRPIKFVRSVETATLFQEAEELLEPTAQNSSKHTHSLTEYIVSESKTLSCR